MPTSAESIQTAGSIYNIGTINTAKFVYEAYKFDQDTIYHIEHIEQAQFLFKSADYQELVQKISGLKDLVTLTREFPDKQGIYQKQLQDAELQQQRFIEDVRNLYITLSALKATEDNVQVKMILQLFHEGKFREANVLLQQADLKKEKDNQLLQLDQLKESLESNAEKYVLKARLALTDLSDANSMQVAMDCFEEAIDNSRKISSPNTVLRMYDYGVLLMNHSYATKAITVFKETAALLAASKEDQTYKRSITATIHNFLAELYMLLNQYQPAELEFNQSVKHFRELTQEYPELFVHDLIKVYNNRGNFKWRAGRATEAFKDYQNCEYLFAQVPEDKREPSMPVMAFMKNNMGNVYASAQYFAEAEHFYTEAQQLLQQLDKKHPGTYAAQLALSDNNIAWAQDGQKKYDEAYANYQQSIAQYRALISQKGALHYPDLALALCNCGILLHHMQRYDEAITVFAEAKELNRKMAAIEPDAYNPSLATVLEYDGEMLFEMKAYEEALKNFYAALTIREAQAAKDPASFTAYVNFAQSWVKRIKQVIGP